MLWTLLLLPLLLLAVSGMQMTQPCFPGCQCEVETFGLFDSFSLTRVDCSGLGPHIVPVPIPLDTAHLDLSSNQLETVNESVLAGPGYTTLAGLDLSHNLLTSISPTAFSRLRYLDLSGNPKLKWAGTEVFSGLGSLQELDLSGTGLVPLPEVLLHHLPALQSVSVGQGTQCRRLVREGAYPRRPGSSSKVALHCGDTQESVARASDIL